MSEANTPGQYYTACINSSWLCKLIPDFSNLNPGIQYGVSAEQSRDRWLARGRYCLGYVVAPPGTGRWCGIAGVFGDFSPDPHFPYRSVAQVDFTAVEPGHPGAALALYQHIKNDLRIRGVEAIVVSRQISAREIRSRLYRL